jgi:hypothetical protein
VYSRRGKGGIARPGDYTIFYRKWKENHQLRTEFFIHQRKVTAVKGHLSDRFPIKNDLKEGDALSPPLSNFVLNMPLGGFKQTGIA